MGASSFGPYEAITLQDHSRWRPEWRTDRVMIWWYLTFSSSTELRPLSSQIQRALAHLECLDLLPLDWLHLTVNDVGYVDVLPPDRLEALATTAARDLAGWQPLRLVLCAPTTMEDAVVLQAHPVNDLTRLRATLHGAVTSLAEPGSVSADSVDEFWPHVSLGYVNRECAQRDILSHLPAELADASTIVTVNSVTLAAVSRVDRTYRWTSLAEIPFGIGQRGLPRASAHVLR